MAGEVSSLEITVSYAVEATTGVRPLAAADYTALVNIKETPDQSLEPEGIEVTDLSDTIRRYVKGLSDPGSSLGFLINITDAIILAWDTTLYGAWETGQLTNLNTWFVIEIPNLSSSYYVAGDPAKLGINSIAISSPAEATAFIVPRETAGWAAVPTPA
jgi:hypothetical protein